MEEVKAREHLLKAIEHVHNAQAHLIENVSPPADPAEVQRHIDRAAGLLVEALRTLDPLCSKGVETPSGYKFNLYLQKE